MTCKKRLLNFPELWFVEKEAKDIIMDNLIAACKYLKDS